MEVQVPEPQAKIMLARYYSASLGRFLAVDPAPESAIPQDPQSWNRYSYARNNPLGRLDPDGRKDKRSDRDKEILEDKNVKEKTEEAWEESNAEGEPNERQEVGFGVTEPSPGTFETTELQTQGNPVQVEMEVPADSAATVHTHPVGNAAITDPQTGERKQGTKKPGKGDQKLADETNAPAYVVAKNKMYRVDPDTGKVKVILSGKEFKAYMAPSE